MVHAAAPCPPDVKRRMLDWWGDSIYEYYAATEGGGTLVTPQEWRKYPGTVGRAWPSAEIKIFDDDEQGACRRRAGHRVHAARHRRTSSTTRTTEKTRKNRIGNYFTVGDVGYLNDEGYLFLCDRKIDMIISGGANIYPAEIENVLLTHPKVADAAVFGIPNEDWGEEVKAVIEPAVGVDAGRRRSTAEILEFCKDKLAKFKTPKIDRLHRRDAARPERQALQAQAARSVLGRTRARDLIVAAHTERRRRRSAFAITETELRLIAAAAIIGLSSRPNGRKRMPAAIGTPSAL